LAEACRSKGVVFREPILVFGSAPLQICLAPEFLSGDVDITVPGDALNLLEQIVEETGLGKESRELYIQVVPSYVFRPGQNWRGRAQIVQLDEFKFLFPDPLDILLGKLRRMEEKDFLAFELVVGRTGHPTQEEMIRELRDSYDQFYLQMDRRKSALWENTEKLWPRIYGRQINVSTEITGPVIEAMAQMGTDRDYLEELKVRLGL
jgi:hypothetical protein